MGLSIKPDLIEGVYLERQLGSGATSTVYLATDREDPTKRFAVKVITQYLIQQEDARRRWDREAELILQLEHPNIVKGIRKGVADNRPYLVMEYLQGENLQDRLRRLGKLEEEEVFDIADATLSALVAAFELNIIHRDVKPANMLRTTEGEIKLMDFGLAKFADDSSITVSGAIVGTPLYVSPEQARCDPHITTKSDLYSLGATLYHLAAGTPPFAELNTSLMLTRKITDDVPDIRLVNPDLSGAMAYLISRLCQRFTEDRPASAKEALDMLRQLREGALTTTHFDVESRSSRSKMRPASFSEIPVHLVNEIIETISSDDQLDTKPHFMEPGEVLFYEDDTSQDCYILLSGSVQVLKSGREVARIQEVGSFIGEMGPLRGHRRSATVVACEASVLLTIAKTDFKNFFKRHPEMLMALAQTLASRLENTTEQLNERTQKLNRLHKMVNEMKGLFGGKF